MSTEISKAGGIVTTLINGQKHLLLIYRHKHQDWSFPKGHQEPGDTLEQTAYKEILEECGIKTEIIKKLPPNEYLLPRDGDFCHCHMYLMKPLSLNIQPEFIGDKTLWVEISQVRNKLTYDQLKIYFDQILPLI